MNRARLVADIFGQILSPLILLASVYEYILSYHLKETNTKTHHKQFLNNLSQLFKLYIEITF